jgi:glycerol kinase
MPVHDKRFLLAVDQGTSGTSAVLYRVDGQPVAQVDVPVASYYPAPGWVEQNPFEILDSVRHACRSLIQKTDLRPGQILCLGMAHQGESLLLWDPQNGMPVHNVISWRCVRSATVCDSLISQGMNPDFRQRTGLSLLPEWPATKVLWCQQNNSTLHHLLETRKLVYSQIDAWLMYQLTQERMLRTDHSMASRSGFYNIHTLKWDAELIALFRAENLIFPEIVSSDSYFGEVILGDNWHIAWNANLIDQASSLLGQGCIEQGDTKITYGTCAAFWCNTGQNALLSESITASVAWMQGDQPTYALVGETTAAGAAIGWIKEKFHPSWPDSELASVAQAAGSTNDLIFVPAFSGLGVPYLSPHVRGTLYGLTGDIGPEHILRAGLEAIAFSVRDIVDALVAQKGLQLAGPLKADGGMAANRYLMQFQADILGRQLVVAQNLESTSAGIAFLAGLASGCYTQIEDVKTQWSAACVFEPTMDRSEREQRYARWSAALQHTLAVYSALPIPTEKDESQCR